MKLTAVESDRRGYTIAVSGEAMTGDAYYFCSVRRHCFQNADNAENAGRIVIQSPPNNHFFRSNTFNEIDHFRDFPVYGWGTDTNCFRYGIQRNMGFWDISSKILDCRAVIFLASFLASSAPIET